MSLLPNTNYYFRVKAVSPTAESAYSEGVQVTTLSNSNSLISPLPPSIPVIKELIPTSTGLFVSLHKSDPSEYLLEYKITISENIDFSSPVINKLSYRVGINTTEKVINNTSFLFLYVGNLTKNTNYYLRIASVNTNSTSANRDTTFTTIRPINSPKSIGVTDLLATSATINWNKVDNATGYYIDVASDSSFSTYVVENRDVGNVLEDSISPLIENTTYYYRVRAYNNTDTSQNSNTITFTTLDDVASFPGLTFNVDSPFVWSIQNVSTSEAQIRWYSVENVSSFSIDISVDSDFSTFISEDITTQNLEYTFTGLTESTTYYVRIKSKGINTDSPYSVYSFRTLSLDVLLSLPQAFTPTVILSRGVLFNWLKRSHSNKYLIQVSRQANFSIIDLNVFTEDIDSYLIDSLLPDTTYYLRVKGLNSLTTSNWSNSVTFTTLEALDTITLTVSSITSSSFVLNWSTSLDYTSYAVNIKNNSNSNFIYYLFNVGNVASKSFSLLLESNTEYEVQVIGFTLNGESLGSNILNVTTQNAKPFITISVDGSHIDSTVGSINNIQVSTDSDFKFLLQGWNNRSASNPVNIEPLINQPVNYFIRANRDNGEWSNTLELYNSISPQFLPVKLTNTTALIRWKKLLDEEYSIQFFYLDNDTFLTVTGFSFPKNIGNVDSYFISNLTPNQTYKVVLKKKSNNVDYVNDFKSLEFSTNRTNSTYQGLSVGGTSPVVSVSDISEFQLTLNANTSSYDYITIEVSERTDSLTVEKYIESVTDQTVITNLQPDTLYTILVRGVSGTDITNPSSVTGKTVEAVEYDDNLVNTPSISSVAVLNENEANITISNFINLDSVTVEVSRSNTFNYLEDVSLFRNVNQIVIANLLPVHIYYVRIYEANENSLTSYSNISTINTSL